MRRVLGALVALATTTTWAFVQPTNAHAQTTGTQREFGIKAALFGKTDLEKGHFAYAIPRGTSVRDAAEVINYTQDPLTLNVYGADVHTAAGGGALAPAQRNAEMKHVGKWLTLDDPSQATLVVPPLGRLRVPFTVTIPADSAFGDFPGALVVSKPAPKLEGQVTVEPRVALLVDVTVPGSANVAMNVGRPSASRVDDGYRFETDVTNRGNVLVTVKGVVEVRDGGKVVTRVPLDREGIYVIPGGKTTLTGLWDDPPLFGRRTATVRVRAYVDEGFQKTFASRSIALTIIPWRIVGTVLAVVGALAGIAFLSRRRIGAWRGRRREDREILRRHRANADGSLT